MSVQPPDSGLEAVDYDRFTYTPLFDVARVFDTGFLQLVIAIVAIISTIYMAYALPRKGGSTGFLAYAGLFFGAATAGMLSYVIFLSLRSLAVVNWSSSFMGFLVLVHVALLLSLFTAFSQLRRIRNFISIAVFIVVYVMGFLAMLELLFRYSFSASMQANFIMWMLFLLVAALVSSAGCGLVARLVLGDRTLLDPSETPVYSFDMDMMERYEARKEARTMSWLKAAGVAVLACIALEIVFHWSSGALVNADITRTFASSGDGANDERAEFDVNPLLLVKNKRNYDSEGGAAERFEIDYNEKRYRTDIRGYTSDGELYYHASEEFGESFAELQGVLLSDPGLQSVDCIENGTTTRRCYRDSSGEAAWKYVIFSTMNSKWVAVEYQYYDEAGKLTGFAQNEYDGETGLRTAEVFMGEDGSVVGRWEFGYSADGVENRRRYYSGSSQSPSSEGVLLPDGSWSL